MGTRFTPTISGGIVLTVFLSYFTVTSSRIVSRIVYHLHDEDDNR